MDRKSFLIPSRRQWNQWTLPSKLTALAAWIAIVSLIVGLGYSLVRLAFNAWEERQNRFEGESVVLHFKESVMHCEWRLIRLPDLHSITITETPDCPRDVVWSPDNTIMMFRSGGQLYWRIWREGAESIPMGELPFRTENALMEPLLYFDALTNRPRVGLLVEPLIQSEDERRRTYVAIDREFTVNIQDCELGPVVERTANGYRRGGIPMADHLERTPFCRESYFYSDRSGFSPDDDGTGTLIELPEHGISWIAVVLEFGEDQVWRVVEAAPTKSEADDTPGLEVLPSIQEDIASNATLRELMNSCGEHECMHGFSDAQLPNLLAQFEGHKVTRMGGGYGRLGEADEGYFAFPVVQGGSLHQHAPVVFCERNCFRPVDIGYPLDSKWVGWPGQIDLNLVGDYVLITEEYDGVNGEVFDISNGRRVASFKEGKSFMLPDSLSSAFFEQRR